jgi:hypothetical protein
MRIIGIAICLGVFGCVDYDDVSIDETEQESTANNGVSLNGVSLNGVSLNGVSLNGVSLNGVSLNGVSLNGVSLNGSSLNGSTINSATLVGSKWTGTLSDGTTLNLRIDTASKGTGTNSDVGMYGVSYQTSGGWQKLCGVDTTGATVLAVSVQGTWNQQQGVTGGGAYTASTTQFTWACRAKTIAKCVELGYKTWLNRTSQLTSCVRMLRGDYCGNGAPYTVDGQLLNVYDNIGVQADTQAWFLEGEWTPSGARCITAKKETRFTDTGQPIPPCIKLHTVPTTSTCGTSFGSGAVLIDEIP